MHYSISRIRYWLEIIALPAFVFLVIHLAGHGFMLLTEGKDHPGHEHAHEADHVSIGEVLFTPEVLIGIGALVLFVWIWHRPGFRKWVPCRHDHCHSESRLPHVLAITAFCLHFFPEAGVRHALINQAMAGEISSIVGMVAFSAHFLLDVLVAVMLSAYWGTQTKKVLSFFLIATVWFTAFFFGEYISFEVAPSAQGGMFLFSAFLLSMFVHKPHRPKKKCVGCCDH